MARRQRGPENVVIHTRGSVLNNGKDYAMSGTGCFYYFRGCIYRVREPRNATTNMRADLLAVVSALDRAISCGLRFVTITTVNQNLVNGCNRYIHKWKRNGFVTTSGGPVQHKDLYLAIDSRRGYFEMCDIVKTDTEDPGSQAAYEEAREASGSAKTNSSPPSSAEFDDSDYYYDYY